MSNVGTFKLKQSCTCNMHAISNSRSIIDFCFYVKGMLPVIDCGIERTKRFQLKIRYRAKSIKSLLKIIPHHESKLYPKTTKRFKIPKLKISQS